jgi:hypothetical protein
MREICTSRFDEGEVETECWGDTRAPATERAGNTQGFPTLPRHLPTLLFSTAKAGWTRRKKEGAPAESSELSCDAAPHNDVLSHGFSVPGSGMLTYTDFLGDKAGIRFTSQKSLWFLPIFPQLNGCHAYNLVQVGRIGSRARQCSRFQGLNALLALVGGIHDRHF